MRLNKKDVTQNNGPNYIKVKLKYKDIISPSVSTIASVRSISNYQFGTGRDIIRLIMHKHFSEEKFPGKKKVQVDQQPLSALGPYHEISGDGHNRIWHIGITDGRLRLSNIYAYQDKWTGRLAQMDVVPDCCLAGAVGHLYLDFLEILDGQFNSNVHINIYIYMSHDSNAHLEMLMQLDLDKAEIGWQVAFQIAFWCVCLSRSPMRSINHCIFSKAFAPQINPDVYGSVVLLKSIHNIIIEALWQWLCVRKLVTICKKSFSKAKPII